MVKMSEPQEETPTKVPTKYQVELEKQSLDESVRNEKVKEIDAATDPEKKKNLQFDLEEYDRQLQMKAVEIVRLIGQWSPSNPDGKKVYPRDLLMAIRESPASRRRPDNIPDVLAYDQGAPLKRKSQSGKMDCGGIVWIPEQEDLKLHETKNAWGPAHLVKGEFSTEDDEKTEELYKKAPQKCNSQSGTMDCDGVISIFEREDIKLHETKNAWRPACLVKGEFSTEDKKTEELYKKVRGVLNKLMPQNFETLLSQIKALHIDTAERLQGVVDLVFEKAVNEPNSSVAHALLCSELALMQVPTSTSCEERPEFVNFRKLLITKCQVEFEKQSIDESVRNEKVKEIDAATDPENKKDLQFDLEEYDRQLRMKSVGNIRFIGELFKQNMLTVNIMQRCLKNLLENKDEESLECLCKLLTTVGKELKSKHVNLNSTFNTMKNIVEKKEGKVSNRIRFMLQDVIDLRNSKWIPRGQDLNPKTIDQIKKEADSEQLNIQMMNLVPVTLRRDDWGGSGPNSYRKGRGRNVSDDGWIVNTSRNRSQQFTVQNVKLNSKASQIDEPLGSSLLFGNWGKGSISLSSSLQRSTPAPIIPPPAPKPTMPIPQLTQEQMERRITNSLDEYVTDSCSVEEYFLDIGSVIPPSYYPKMIKDSYLHVFEKSQQARSKTGTLFAKLIKLGKISVEDYCMGLEGILSQAEDLKIDIPKFWDYLAEILVDVICEEMLPLKKFQMLISQGHAAKVLSPLFKLIIIEKGHNFLHRIWQASGLRLADFMPSSQVNSFIEDLAHVSVPDSAPVGENQLSYKQIRIELSELLKAKTSLDDIVNWITANVGERVTENKFIRALATAIFQDSISKNKLMSETLSAHNNLLLKYVDNNPTYELQCLYSLQALINKLKYPEGLLLSICDKLYEEGTFYQQSYISWKTSNDPAEQEGKEMALKQLTSFFKQLDENDEEEYEGFFGVEESLAVGGTVSSDVDICIDLINFEDL